MFWMFWKNRRENIFPLPIERLSWFQNYFWKGI
jgi:hypothetical protein